METEGRGVNALTVFIMGLGVFLMILGPCADFYSITIGLISLIGCWVLAITLRVFYFGGPSEDRRYRYS